MIPTYQSPSISAQKTSLVRSWIPHYFREDYLWKIDQSQIWSQASFLSFPLDIRNYNEEDYIKIGFQSCPSTLLDINILALLCIYTYWHTNRRWSNHTNSVCVVKPSLHQRNGRIHFTKLLQYWRAHVSPVASRRHWRSASWIPMERVSSK